MKQQNWQPSYWLNLVTGEILGQLPRNLDVYRLMAWFERVDADGNPVEDLCAAI